MFLLCADSVDEQYTAHRYWAGKDGRKRGSFVLLALCAPWIPDQQIRNMNSQDAEELQVPLLGVQTDEGEIHLEQAGSLVLEGDVEQGFEAGSVADEQSNKSEEAHAIELVSMNSAWPANLSPCLLFRKQWHAVSLCIQG